MRGTKLHPVEVLPMVAGLLDSGLAYVEAQCEILKAPMPCDVADVIVARLTRFTENVLEFHSAYEQQIAGSLLGPEQQRELARLRDVLAATCASVTEGKRIVEDRKRLNKLRWS